MRVVTIPVTDYQQNCSILICEQSKKAALIDPGGDLAVLIEAIETHDVQVEKVFLTHGHLDHAGAAMACASHFNVPVEGPHISDKYWLDDLEKYAQMLGFPMTKNVKPDRWLNDGENISFGHINMDVIHTPGHTPGHVVFYHKKTSMAFVGDVLFKGSIGRSDFPGGNHQQLIESITQKLWPLGDSVEFVPGHGPNSTFAYERQFNNYVSDHALG